MMRMLLCVGTACWLAACSASTDRLTAPGSVDAASGQTRENSQSPPQPPPLERDPVPIPEASCNAARARWVIGEGPSDQLLERARVAAEARLARFLRPNVPITMEYLGSRLNLHLNETGVVSSVSCG